MYIKARPHTWCTNTSCEPSSGVMKPQPLATLNHLQHPLRRPPPPATTSPLVTTTRGTPFVTYISNLLNTSCTGFTALFSICCQCNIGLEINILKWQMSIYQVHMLVQDIDVCVLSVFPVAQMLVVTYTPLNRFEHTAIIHKCGIIEVSI